MTTLIAGAVGSAACSLDSGCMRAPFGLLASSIWPYIRYELVAKSTPGYDLAVYKPVRTSQLAAQIAGDGSDFNASSEQRGGLSNRGEPTTFPRGIKDREVSSHYCKRNGDEYQTF